MNMTLDKKYKSRDNECRSEPTSAQALFLNAQSQIRASAPIQLEQRAKFEPEL